MFVPSYTLSCKFISFDIKVKQYLHEIRELSRRVLARFTKDFYGPSFTIDYK
jgi:hypothetical protein